MAKVSRRTGRATRLMEELRGMMVDGIINA